MSDTPETDELIRSLNYEQLASTESCYAQMREHARNLERDRNEQCRLLGMSAERECDLRAALDRERALADRLHGALDALDYNLAFAGNTLIGGLRERVTAMRAIALPALAAWKGHAVNRRPTPETDEQRLIDNGDTEPLLEFAEGLERERDEALEEMAKWKDMSIEADKRFVEAVLVRDDLKDQLAAAMMSIRLQQRREQQTNEQP